MTDTSKRNFLVDTNLLVYLIDEKSEFYLSVFKFFEWVEKSNNTLVVAHQNILELMNTLIVDYKLELKEASDKANKLLAGREFRIIFPLPSTLDKFFSFLKKPGKRTFDLYLAATAIDNGIDTIATNNKDDFLGVKEFKVLDLEDLKKVMDEDN